MSIWDDAAAALATDLHLGTDAVYRQAGRMTATTLRVVRAQPDQVLVGMGGTPFHAATDVLMVPLASLPAEPARGDTFALGATILTVLDVMTDENAASWRVACDR